MKQTFLVDKNTLSIKEKYGFVPTSVMNFKAIPEKWQSIDELLDIDLTRRSKTTVVLPELKYSKFSYGLSEFVLDYWTQENDIVYDPFMGWGIRGAVSILMNRKYIGVDISKSMYERAGKFLNDIMWKINPDTAYYLHHADSTRPQPCLKNNNIDFIFSCPPYYNLEVYPDNDDNQLSRQDSYDDFLMLIGDCLIECYKLLKHGKYAAFVVADWRDKGYKLFHSHFIELAHNAGFELWDVIVLQLNSPFAFWKCGANERAKYTAKSHEYLLVFKKVS